MRGGRGDPPHGDCGGGVPHWPAGFGGPPLSLHPSPQGWSWGAPLPLLPRRGGGRQWGGRRRAALGGGGSPWGPEHRTPPLRGLYTSIGPARPVGLSRRFPTVPRRFPGSGRGFTAASSSSSAAPGGSGPSRESFIQTRNGKGEAEPQRHLGEDRRAAILGGTPEVLAAQGGSRLRGGSGVILEEL